MAENGTPSHQAAEPDLKEVARDMRSDTALRVVLQSSQAALLGEVYPWLAGGHVEASITNLDPASKSPVKIDMSSQLGRVNLAATTRNSFDLSKDQELGPLITMHQDADIKGPETNGQLSTKTGSLITMPLAAVLGTRGRYLLAAGTSDAQNRLSSRVDGLCEFEKAGETTVTNCIGRITNALGGHMATAAYKFTDTEDQHSFEIRYFKPEQNKPFASIEGSMLTNSKNNTARVQLSAKKLDLSLQ